MKNDRHTKVVVWIKTRKREKWSLADLTTAAPGRRNTLYDILYRLQQLGYINRVSIAWRASHWFLTEKGIATSATDIVADYEMYMLVRMSVKLR